MPNRRQFSLFHLFTLITLLAVLTALLRSSAFREWLVLSFPFVYVMGPLWAGFTAVMLSKWVTFNRTFSVVLTCIFVLGISLVFAFGAAQGLLESRLAIFAALWLLVGGTIVIWAFQYLFWRGTAWLVDTFLLPSPRLDHSDGHQHGWAAGSGSGSTVVAHNGKEL